MKPAAVRLLLSAALSFLLTGAFAQSLQANFSTDKTGGCSPLTINFTNTTTNASPGATWEWDFGNGNTSSLKDPAAIFTESKTYTIKLTVKDGQQTSVQTRTVSVYRKPEISLTITPANACGILSATFSASMSGGDGSVNAWHWDFGDGTTQQTSYSTTTHTYNFNQTASVSLTAVSNYGCTNTITKENAITVKDPLLPGFTADKTVICDAQGTIQFTNTSSGPGTLSYAWDFGDGTTSSLASPAHLYNNKGTYTVKLTVTNAEGCRETVTKQNYINVRNFTTDFTVPAINCEQRTIQFNNQSSPQPTQSTWFVNNTAVYTGYYGGMNYTFPSSGTYTVKLVNKFGSCDQEEIKQVTVHKNPPLSGFIIDAPLCGAPATVKFKDTTAEAIKWKWDFNYYYYNQPPQATVQAPSYTYTYNGFYSVLLEVENQEGCTSSVIKSVSIRKQEANIYIKSGNNYGCAPLKIGFGTSSTDPISNTVWQFGDGTTSTDANPEHTFMDPGRYSVTLNYVNNDGCPASAAYTIEVKKKPKADFSVQSQVCGNTPVVFTNTTTPIGYNYLWNFGDNIYFEYLSGYNATHKYQQEGDYTVQLIAYDGQCTDTVTKTAVIHASPPFPRIDNVINTCDGDRGLVKLTESSRQAQSWAWSFDNGPSVAYTPPGPVSHSFTTTGIHKAVLITTNGACTVKDSIDVPVLMKQKPLLKLTKNELCLNEGTGFSITNLETNPRPVNYSYHYYELYKWEYEDGTTFQANAGLNNYWQNEVSGNLYPTKPGQGRVRAIIVSSHFNCFDTTNFVDLKINGPDVGFEIVTDKRCYNLPVVLRDTSKANGSPIVSWTWDFGDGQTLTRSQGGEVSHLYKPGIYYARLSVTDAKGCSAQMPFYSNAIIVNGVKAAFTTYPGNTVNQNTTVSFYNSSISYSYGQISWSWDFGDGSTSSEWSPNHTYTTAGTYTVKLTATDLGSGCSETVTSTITVVTPVPNRDLNSFTAFIGDAGSCPPVKASFDYSSNIAYTRLHWDFGDGFTLDGINSRPSHIYVSPGTYFVTLNVYNNAILTDSWKDTVQVFKPPVAFSASDLSVCLKENIQLFSTVPDSSFTYTWDFGNGNIINGPDSLFNGQYMTAGTYTPSLIITDNKGCRSALTSADKIIVFPDPVISILPGSPVVCKNNGIQLEATGAQAYTWSPATGLNDNTVYNPVANPSSTASYSVTGTDINGCTGQNLVTVTVPEPFNIQVNGKTEICKGSVAQLNAAGADSYLWINNVSGLSNIKINNPEAKPETTTSYTVVGYDQYKCYSDTVVIPVVVHPLPVLNAGPDLEVLIGSSNALQVTGSSDIVRWQWTPAEFLSCSNCAAPVVVPFASTEYIVTGTTIHNCVAKDTVNIKALCIDGNVHIPSGFTPNNDGLNDKFTISANVSKVISLQIFNRWGEIIFEAKNFIPGSSSGSWNGRYKGGDAPSGTYVYLAVFECQAGTRFERKGTITLLR